MDEKKIAKMAKKVAKLEKRLDYEEDVALVEAEMQALISGLSPEDLVQIDEYIMVHHLMD